MSNKEEQNYLDLLKDILDNGNVRSDRTGTGTTSIFGSKLSFSLANNVVPMFTTKKMFSRGIIEELLFFLRGDTDTKMLEAKGVNIWKGNTSREFLDKRGLNHLPEGDMGYGYGFQWRRFGRQYDEYCYDEYGYDFAVKGTDQLKQVINTLKTNPTDRRMIISAWNPNQLDQAALPPCHIMVQFYVNDNKLSSQFYMRSTDTFLGLPFNILSYAIMTRIIAQTIGMESDKLIFVGGDTHIYNNHKTQVNQQITREPFAFPAMLINKKLETVEDIENLKYEDFEFNGYNSHAALTAPMAI